MQMPQIQWRAVVQTFSRQGVDEVRDPVQGIRRERAQVGALWQRAADNTVPILIRATLERAVRVCVMYFGAILALHLLRRQKFRAVVEGDCLEDCRKLLPVTCRKSFNTSTIISDVCLLAGKMNPVLLVLSTKVRIGSFRLFRLWNRLPSDQTGKNPFGILQIRARFALRAATRYVRPPLTGIPQWSVPVFSCVHAAWMLVCAAL
jgi:hypothetical protein